MPTIRWVFVVLVALAVVQVVIYYPRLPDVMASHFDVSGQADGWMSKPMFFAIDLGMVALTALIFLGITVIRWPARLFNVPRRDYWLAPERRDETLRHFNRWMLIFGCATLVLLLVVMQWTIEANLDGSGTLPAAGMWWLVGGYLLFSVVWTGALILRYLRVPPESGTGSGESSR